MNETINRLILDACLTFKDDLRYTLSGLPVVEALFQHNSIQVENGFNRQVNFDLQVVSVNETALILAKSEIGRHYRLQGFINRKSLKSVKLRLHVTHISPIN